MARLVAVSNRVPSLASGAKAGGLVVGVKAALEETGGLWFGWSGRLKSAPSAAPRLEQADSFTLATLDLSQDEYEGFYEGFSNRTLWPLLHGRLDLMTIDAASHASYQAVNERFARALVPLLRPDDCLWIHDYHLIPLSRKLRGLGVAIRQGFFLHVPFPPAETFAALPWHAELMRDLCSYDLIGFQSERDYVNFCDFVTREMGGIYGGDGSLRVLGRRLHAGVFPIGIDAQAFAGLAASPHAEAAHERLRRCRGEQTWIVGVDRLDYTKGLAERFRALELLFERSPKYREKACLVQVAAPSREGVPEYLRMRAELEALSGRVNGRFAELDWVPIRFINRAFGHVRLAALYRLAKAALVTPLRDGMNMVAKEYVAAQDPDDPGVLLLSRFAGAAERMSGAVLVNPYDVQGLASDLAGALEMPLRERRARWQRLMTEVEQHDIHDWRRRFLAALDAAAEPDSEVVLRAVSNDPAPSRDALGKVAGQRRARPVPTGATGATVEAQIAQLHSSLVRVAARDGGQETEDQHE